MIVVEQDSYVTIVLIKRHLWQFEKWIGQLKNTKIKDPLLSLWFDQQEKEKNPVRCSHHWHERYYLLTFKFVY